MQENTKKRWMTVAAVCACMLAFVLSIVGNHTTVKADDTQTQVHYEKDGLSYTFTGTGDRTNPYYANIEGYNATAEFISATNGSLTIPSSVPYTDPADGAEYDVTVRGVLNNAFAGCTSLKTLTLPYTVNYIGQSAFENCTNLTNITTIDQNENKLGDIVLAETLEYRAFAGCTALAGLTLEYGAGSSVKEVKSEAFYGCTGLRSFTIGAGVTDIGAGFLANCTGLDGALNSIKVVNNNRFFVTEGILYQRVSNTNNILVQCPTGKLVTNETVLADYITQIKDEAFYGCKNLYSFDVPNTVTSIGYRSFYGCTSIGNVTIPDTVTSIGAEAFANCGSSLCITCTSGSVADDYAKNNNIARNVTCTVTFYNTFTRETVTRTTLNGGTVDPPTGWDRDGYVLRWSNNYDAGTVIESSMTIYTEWKRLFTITFKDDYSGQESIMAGVEEGTAVDPPNWTRKGYRLSWSTEAYKNVTADVTIYAIWLVSLTDSEIEESKYTVGTIVTVSNIRYKITSTANKYVHVVGMSNTAVKSLSIPDVVTFGGTRYRVRAIATNAFRSNKNIRFVSIGKYVKTIGRGAFYGCSGIRRITIYSRGVSTFGVASFRGTYSKLHVYTMTDLLAKRYRPYMLDAGMSSGAKVRKLS